MGALKECENQQCGQVYDTGKFGAGPKYCCRRCRAESKTGIITVRPIGRPPLNPRATPIMKAAIVNYLKRHGWTINEPFLGKPYRIVASRGWYTAKIVIGGTQHEGRWADVFAFYRDDKKGIVFQSTCRRMDTVRHIPRKESHLTTAKKIKAPCNQPACRDCSKAVWFREIIRVDKESKSG